MMPDYWESRAVKHERMAATLRAKYAATGESRWLKQAETNKLRAQQIRCALGAAAIPKHAK